jgi:hypothetical protein
MRYVPRPLHKRQCMLADKGCIVHPIPRGAMTASAYIFAIAMAVVIVWLVAEVSGQDAFKL